MTLWYFRNLWSISISSLLYDFFGIFRLSDWPCLSLSKPLWISWLLMLTAIFSSFGRLWSHEDRCTMWWIVRLNSDKIFTRYSGWILIIVVIFKYHYIWLWSFIKGNCWIFTTFLISSRWLSFMCFGWNSSICNCGFILLWSWYIIISVLSECWICDFYKHLCSIILLNPLLLLCQQSTCHSWNSSSSVNPSRFTSQS